MENESEILFINEWEVETPYGWKSFEGLRITDNQRCIKLTFDDNSFLECTLDHLIWDGTQFIEAKFLKIGSICDDKIITQIEHIGLHRVYDLLEVEDVHCYYTNNVVSHNCLLLDEFGFVENAEEFMTSTYPVITQGKSSKVIIVSTPNGIGNQFHKIYTESVSKKNSFVNQRVIWSDVPGRDEAWKEETIRNTSARQFAQEQSVSFLGSSDTLIQTDALLSIAESTATEIKEDDNLHIFENPREDAKYLLTADVAKGRGQDFSTFTIFDISVVPVKVVCTFADSFISPILFATTIYKYATLYNQAFAIIEANDQGSITCQNLYYDLEYANMYVSSILDDKGIGIEVNKKIKAIGCSTLKDWIEEKKLSVTDSRVVQQLYTFVRDGTSFNASEGQHDDFVSNLWLFAWFTTIPMYQECLKNASLANFLFEEKMRKIERDLPHPDFFKTLGRADSIQDYMRLKGYEMPLKNGEFTDQHLIDSPFFKGRSMF